MKTTRKIKMVAGLLFATTIVVQAATPVTNGLYVELIADNLSLTNGASVTNWNDTVGNVSLATYGGYTAPTFVSSDTNFNNHSTVNFTNATLRDITLGGTAPSTENMTVFMVARFNAQPDNSNAEWLFQSQVKVGGNNNNRFRIARSNTTYLNSAYQTRVGGGGGLATANGSGRSTDLAIFNVRSGSDVVNLDVITATNTLSATGANGTGQDWARIVLGNSGNNKNYANANIAEMLVYDHALTSNEVVQVNTYLKDKYFGGAGPGPGLTTPVITSIDFSAGTVSVTATNLSIGSSCVLIRSDDLTGTFTNEIYTISPVTNQVGVLQDTNPPPANAFYKVESTK